MLDLSVDVFVGTTYSMVITLRSHGLALVSHFVSPHLIKTAWHHHCSRLEHGTDLGIKFVTTKSSLTDGQRMTQDKVRQGSPLSLVKAVEGRLPVSPGMKRPRRLACEVALTWRGLGTSVEPRGRSPLSKNRRSRRLSSLVMRWLWPSASLGLAMPKVIPKS